MSWEDFESDILEIVNEDTLTDALVRRKIHAAVRRIESLWNFPYMFEYVTVAVPVGNAPIAQYDVEWKSLKKVGLWSASGTNRPDLDAHGRGSLEFQGFLQRLNEDDLKVEHFDTLNVETAWDQPLFYQIQRAGFVLHPIYQTTRDRVFRTQFQLYPPSDVVRTLELMGYAYTTPYDDTNLTDDHWLLQYGRELLEAWTILSLTPALQDATLFKFYESIVASAQETLLKSEANSDMEGIDETAEYMGESDI